MLYTRSSFLKYLTKKCECEAIPLKDTRGIRIKNGPAGVNLWSDKNDRIDYEEIALLCAKLYIGLPGDKDLERIE